MPTSAAYVPARAAGPTPESQRSIRASKPRSASSSLTRSRPPAAAMSVFAAVLSDIAIAKATTSPSRNFNGSRIWRSIPSPAARCAVSTVTGWLQSGHRCAAASPRNVLIMLADANGRSGAREASSLSSSSMSHEASGTRVSTAVSQKAPMFRSSIVIETSVVATSEQGSRRRRSLRAPAPSCRRSMFRVGCPRKPATGRREGGPARSPGRRFVAGRRR
jgi:hypothetical protein